MTLLVAKDKVLAEAQREIDLAWCGGYVTARGSLGVRNYSRRTRRYNTSCLQYVRPLEEYADLLKLCQVTRIPVTPQKQHQARGDKAVLLVQGESLDELMKVLWKHLGESRKAEYRALMRRLHE